MSKNDSLSESDRLVYSVYRSSYNKESLDYLRYEMTLNEFMRHREYVTEMEDLEYASHLDQEIKNKTR